MTMQLEPRDHALLDGEAGEGVQLAMRVLTAAGEATDATRMIDISSAHVASVFFAGQVSLDFAERFVRAGAKVAVPTTLNVGLVDLLHPELYAPDDQLAADGRRLMEYYTEMGCEATFTCAPYLRELRPGLGEHVAWGESNAVSFANSVLGARTAKYTDFLNICAAIAGRVPETGRHRDEQRRGQVLVTVEDVPERLLAETIAYHALGYLVGRTCGSDVPVIVGLPGTTHEDQLKALGGAAASAGGVELYHVVGVTPEAPTAEAAFQGGEPERAIRVTARDLLAARRALSTREDGQLAAVCLGTPHLSLRELEELAGLFAETPVHPNVRCYAHTSRETLVELRRRGGDQALREAGVIVVVDTCTYFAPILRMRSGMAMTNSAKWAYYAPGNLQIDVAFGSTAECLRSASLGHVWHDAELWGDA